MAFRLVSSGGAVVEPVVVNLAASGLCRPGEPVDLVPGGGTGGAVVCPSTSASTTTMVLGICAGPYVQGASDTYTNVILTGPHMIWEADCTDINTTAQVGLRHTLSASDRGCVKNTATDTTTQTGIFLALAMTGLATGSGKLLGILQGYNGKLISVTDTTLKQ
jgi:hypothetical protein